MKKCIICLVGMLVLGFGCSSRTHNMGRVRGIMPDGEIYCMEWENRFIVRNSSNEVWLVDVGPVFGMITKSKVFNAR